MKNKAIIIISSIVNLLAIIAIGITIGIHYPRHGLNFDYLGLIVGILALLVTLLIGWQIYDKIGLEEKINRIVDKKIKECEEKLGKEQIQTMLISYKINLQCYEHTKHWFAMITLQTNMSYLISYLKDENEAKLLCDRIRKLSENYKDFNDSEQDAFWGLIYSLDPLSKVYPNAVLVRQQIAQKYGADYYSKYSQA